MNKSSKKVENKHKYTAFQFIMLTLLITLIFYCTTHFSRNFFQIIKYTEIRFSGVLNPVLSMFYGFPAIIGCTLGNFLVDCTPTILNGTPMEDMKQNLLYLIPQFLYGFVPYFLWNHVFYKNKENKYRFQDAKKVVLFAVTMIIASLVLEAESLNKFYTICLCVLIGITLIVLPIINAKKSSSND